MWLLALKDLSINPENVLRRALLPADLFHRDSARLSTEAYFRLWSSLENENTGETLPLKLAEVLSPEMFHPVIFAALCSPNLLVAVKRIAEYKRLLAPVIVQIDETEDTVFVGLEMEDSRVKLPTTLALTELVYCTMLARLGTRERICPLKVECLERPSQLAEYKAFFGAHPQKSNRHGLLFKCEDTRRPFLTASESLWQVFESDLRRKLHRADAPLPLYEQVKDILLEALPSGETSINAIASRLAISPRTLQRRLQAENTSFKDLVRNTREQLAQHYVTQTRLTYPEVAFLLGFTEASSFFRAYRDWTGTTPDAVRYAKKDN